MPLFASEFPTRKSSYARWERPTGGFESAQPSEAEVGIELAPGVLHRLGLGVDAPPAAPMTAAAIESLKDPFAELLLKRQQFPLTLRDLLSQLDQHNADPAGLPTQRSFVVADGGKILWSPETGEL